MKPRGFLLWISLAANALLFVVLVLRPAATTAFFRAVFQTGDQPNPAASSAEATPQTIVAAQAKSAAFVWSEFQSGDFAGLVARLRAAGFPPSIVRTIVAQAISDHYSARRGELIRNRLPTEYWKSVRFDAATQNALRELGREQEQLLRELLGPELGQNGSSGEWIALNRQRQFGSLAPAKIDQLQKIAADYDELTAKVHEDRNGIMLPEDRAKLALLEKERRADIERLLTPDELLDYDLRNSPSAHQVLGQLGQIEVTEQEFRALYATQKSYNEQRPRLTQPQPGVAQQRRDAFDDNLQNALGAARYAEFKQAQANEAAYQDSNAEQIDRLVARLNLPPATTATVVAVQMDVRQRATALRTDRALSAEQRTAQLASLATEATTKLTEALGARGLEAYKQNGGQWLPALTRSPTSGRGSVSSAPGD